MKQFIIGSFSSPLTIWNWDEQAGSFSFVSTVCDDGQTTAPTWISQSSCGEFIYCTNELPEGATVGSYRLLPAVSSGLAHLQFLSRVDSVGGWPCHIALAADIAVVSNFKSGTVRFLPILSDGSLGASLLSIDDNDNTSRLAHAHQVVWGPNDLFYVVDLGMDAIYSFKKAPSGWNHPPHLLETCRFPPNVGPRHVILHPNGRFAYAMTEMGNAVYVMHVNSTTGSLHLCDDLACVYSTLREGESGDGMGGAEILMSDDDKYIYVSNRDISESTEDRSSIAVFSVDPGSNGGYLKLIQHVYSGGRHPRHMAITSDGGHLVVANKESHNFATFTRNIDSGLLSLSPIFVTDSSDHCRDPSMVLELH